MKIQRLLVSCFVLVTTGIFSSCQYEPLEGDFGTFNPGDNPGDSPGSTAVFEVEIDGEVFTADEVEAEINEDGLNIAAQTGMETFGIQIFEPVVGSFDLSNEENGLLIYSPNVSSEELAYNLSAGTVTITEIDTQNGTISGTFQGTLSEWLGEAEDIELTNGVFENIPFSQESPQDFATALIDGEEFNANTFVTAESGNMISLNFMSNVNSAIVLTLPVNEISVGEHTVTALGQPYSASYSVVEGSSSQTYISVANSGNINIISYQNGILTGTFSFNAVPFGATEPVKSITQGEFSMDIN